MRGIKEYFDYFIFDVELLLEYIYIYIYACMICHAYCIIEFMKKLRNLLPSKLYILIIKASSSSLNSVSTLVNIFPEI